MKKFLSLLMAVMMMATVLSGCGGKKEELTFTTGSETGTYYGFGTVLAGQISDDTDTTVTAIVGKAIGAGFLFGGAKTLGADMVYALPGAEISTLTAKTGVAFLWNDRITAEKTREDLEKEWSEAAAPEAAAAMGEVDDIVEPAELRARVLAALMMLRDKRA